MCVHSLGTCIDQGLRLSERLKVIHWLPFPKRRLCTCRIILAPNSAFKGSEVGANKMTLAAATSTALCQIIFVNDRMALFTRRCSPRLVFMFLVLVSLGVSLQGRMAPKSNTHIVVG
jgi:hypothetical protein